MSGSTPCHVTLSRKTMNRLQILLVKLFQNVEILLGTIFRSCWWTVCSAGYRAVESGLMGNERLTEQGPIAVGTGETAFSGMPVSAEVCHLTLIDPNTTSTCFTVFRIKSFKAGTTVWPTVTHEVSLTT